MKTKRFYLFLLVALMSVTGAWAQGDDDSEDVTTSGDVGNMHWEYDEDNMILTFSSTTGSPVAMPDYQDEDRKPWSFWLEGTVSARFINISHIGDCALKDCRELTSVDIPNTVTSIGKTAFKDCRSLTSVVFPNTVTSIGDYAFAGCDGLTSVVLPNSVSRIGSYAFADCLNLASINIPNRVRVLSYTFWKCSSLTSITIPASVETLEGTFFWCGGLTSITVASNTPPSVVRNSNCFAQVKKNIPVYVLDGTVDDYRAAYGWNEFTNFREFDSMAEYTLADKDPYSEDRNYIVDNFSYTRTFNNTNEWQCWYVPFDATVDETKFKAAEIAGILFDSERNAIVAFNKLDDGAVLKANTPYVVKALTESLRWNLTDAKLYAAVDNSFTIQSAYDNYTIRGFYSQQSDENCYTLNNSGDFQKMGSATLKPQRFWMSVTPRLDGPYAGNSASAKPVIRMMVLGDDEFGVTGIEDVMQNAASTSSPTGIYNLNGQKVSAPQRGNVYIVNGKKFVMK